MCAAHKAAQEGGEPSAKRQRTSDTQVRAPESGDAAAMQDAMLLGVGLQQLSMGELLGEIPASEPPETAIATAYALRLESAVMFVAMQVLATWQQPPQSTLAESAAGLVATHWLLPAFVEGGTAPSLSLQSLAEDLLKVAAGDLDPGAALGPITAGLAAWMTHVRALPATSWWRQAFLRRVCRLLTGVFEITLTVAECAYAETVSMAGGRSLKYPRRTALQPPPPLAEADLTLMEMLRTAAAAEAASSTAGRRAAGTRTLEILSGDAVLALVGGQSATPATVVLARPRTVEEASHMVLCMRTENTTMLEMGEPGSLYNDLLVCKKMRDMVAPLSREAAWTELADLVQQADEAPAPALNAQPLVDELVAAIDGFGPRLTAWTLAVENSGAVARARAAVVAAGAYVGEVARVCAESGLTRDRVLGNAAMLNAYDEVIACAREALLVSPAARFCLSTELASLLHPWSVPLDPRKFRRGVRKEVVMKPATAACGNIGKTLLAARAALLAWVEKTDAPGALFSAVGATIGAAVFDCQCGSVQFVCAPSPLAQLLRASVAPRP